MMENVNVCHICLTSGDSLWDLFQFPFKQEFNICTGIELPELNEFSHWICNHCLHQIKKFCRFRKKAQSSHSFFKNNIIKLQFDEKGFVEMLENQRKNSSFSLGQSNTLLLNSYSLNKEEKQLTDVISLTNKNKIEKNYCKNMKSMTTLDNHLIIDCTNNSHSNGTENLISENNENILNFYEVKLEEVDVDFPELNKMNKRNLKEVKSRKRKAKEAGEKKRAVDCEALQSEQEYSNFDYDDDSTVDVPQLKRSKKQSKNKKSTKRKISESSENNSFTGDEYEKCNSETQSGNKKASSNPEFSSRMVLETEQYKVIKLTHEQLLMEMVTNSKSERYLNSPYKCDLCIKGFNYEDVLQNHMLKHEPKNGPFECDLCHQFLPSAVSMRGHKKSHSTKYQCKQCGVVKASRQHLLEHYMLIHEGAPRTYICNVCGKTLTKRTMFQKHMRIHYPSNKIACDKCGKLFKTIETLRAHMLHHEDGSLTRHADVKRYSCDQCPKAFRYASLLYTHKVTHITTKDYYCVECDMHFKTQSNLKLHLRKSMKHLDPDLLVYACDRCDKRYEDEKGLRHHIDWVHLGQKNFKCSKCDMQFGSQDGLRSHMKKIHDGIRPPRKHICDVCNKAFRARAVLVKHQRIHTGERPYECNECGKKFAQNSTMSTHIKLVHLKMNRHVNKKSSSGTAQVAKKVETETHIPVNEPTQTLRIDPSYYYPTASTTDTVRPVCLPILPLPVQYHEVSRM